MLIDYVILLIPNKIHVYYPKNTSSLVNRKLRNNFGKMQINLIF